jgi:hypothetical protein
MTSETLTRYRFPAADGALWLGLRLAPIATIASALTLTVLALYAGAPLPAGVATLTVGVVAATVPVADRTVVEWTPLALRRLVNRATGQTRWVTGALPCAPAKEAVAVPVRLPASGVRLRLLEVDGIGVVDDPRARQRTVVLAVAGSDRFPMIEPLEQHRLLAAWGNALTGLAADTRVRRVQWIERAAPEDRDPAAWLDARVPANAEPTAVADYRQLAASIASAAFRHDVWLAVAFDRDPDVDALPAAATQVTAGLLAAQLSARPLSLAETAELLRRGLDGTANAGAVTVQQVAALSHQLGWESLRTDDCWHRAFAVTGWPRLPVHTGWLEPLLVAAPPQAVRTVSVHLRPVAAQVAMRQARATRARARLDAADRSRLGLLDSPRLDVDQADAAAAEEELVAGYRLHHVAASITVSAGSAEQLNGAARAIRTAAQTARLELRPLHGQHQHGLVSSLPLCRPDGAR